jgi:hypothetical protein
MLSRRNLETMHMVMKCAFNDGVQADEFEGWQGLCTPSTMRYNVRRSSGLWCTLEECECREWIDEWNPDDWTPIDSCWESRLFREWKMGTGFYHSGPLKGLPRRPRQHHKGAIVLLTTVEPGKGDIDRVVFGVLGNTFLDRQENGAYVVAGERKYSLALTRENWLSYYEDVKDEIPNRWWGSGLFRYLDEQEVFRYLDNLEAHLEGVDLFVLEYLRKDVVGSYDPKQNTR